MSKYSELSQFISEALEEEPYILFHSVELESKDLAIERVNHISKILSSPVEILEDEDSVRYSVEDGRLRFTFSYMKKEEEKNV